MKAFVTRSVLLAAALAAIGGCSTSTRDNYSDDAAAAGQSDTSQQRSNLDNFFHGNDEAKTHNSAL